MKSKAMLTGLLLLLVFTSFSFKCDSGGGSTPPDSPWRPAAKAADDLAGGINTMIKVKRELAQKGSITPAEERALTNSLLKVNTADKLFVKQVKAVKNATDASTSKPNVCTLFAAVTSALSDLNNTGVLPIADAGAKARLTTLLNALNASAAIIASTVQCP